MKRLLRTLSEPFLTGSAMGVTVIKKSSARKMSCDRAQVHFFFLNWGKVNGKRGEGRSASGDRRGRRETDGEKETGGGV